MKQSRSPSPKRIKLDLAVPTVPIKSEGDESAELPEPEEEPEEEDRCSICLQEVVDRTVVPICSHEFCFECLIEWSAQSRRCPLCSQAIGDFLIHRIRSRYDYQKHYLNPLRTSPTPLQPLVPRQARPSRRRVRNREWGRREATERDEADKLDRSIAKRRWIYEHDLYAKHVASNSYTRYRPYPAPAQFAASPDLISRTTMFLRRELQVWVNLDVEFLTTFIISIMKAIDIRSESAVKLLSEFLDLDAPYIEGGRHINAEHFAHEVYSYVRSPYKDLFVYDSVVQYEVSPEVPPPQEEPRRRWREPTRSASPLPRDSRGEGTSRAHSYSRSVSPSPSRRYTNSGDTQLEEHTSRGSNDGTRHSSRHPRDTSVVAADQPQPPIHPKVEIQLPPLGVSTISETLNPNGKNPSILSALSSDECIVVDALPSPIAKDSVTVPPLGARKPARVRNRSLFESVQAHLALPTREDRATTTGNSIPAPSRFSSTSQPRRTDLPPSLLTRLSDPVSHQSMVNDKGSVGTGNIAPSDDLLNVARDNGLSLPVKTSLSPPEIMARTRARLAKSTNQEIDQTHLTLNRPSVPLQRSSVPALSLGSEQASGPDGNVDISTSLGHGGDARPSKLRTRLLNRLEEERQRACNLSDINTVVGGIVTGKSEEAADVDDRISQGQPPGLTSQPTLVDAAEARLRRQAQLRVRLAAEKREHSSK